MDIKFGEFKDLAVLNKVSALKLTGPQYTEANRLLFKQVLASKGKNWQLKVSNPLADEDRNLVENGMSGYIAH